MDDDNLFQPARRRPDNVLSESEYSAFEEDPTERYLYGGGLHSEDHHQTKQKTIVYDMTNRETFDFVEGTISPGKLDEINFRTENVEKTFDQIEGLYIFILGAKKTGKYLQIKLSSKAYFCLEIRQGVSIEGITEQMSQIRSSHSSSRRYGVLGKQIKAVKRSKNFALFHNRKCITVPDALNLKNLAVVELVPVIPVSWRICYHYKLFCNKQYLLQCSSVDSLAEVKAKFLTLFQRSEEIEDTEVAHVDCVWFTQGNKVLTEELLNQTFKSTMDGTSGCLLLKTIPHMGMGINVSVYFQPPTAISAEVTLKTDSAQTSVGLLVLSPEQSASRVREEVAKLVGREPESIKILLENVELNDKVSLDQPLSGRRITVTAKQKISLSVHVLPFRDGGEEALHIIPVYSYDKVQVLKSELVKKLHTPPDLVDLFFNNIHLDDGSSFRYNRIRDRDQLEARVFPRRQTLMVRMPDRQWQELIVDDSRTVNMGQIKTFCQTLKDPVPCCEVTAIVGDRVVSDTETLHDASAGQALTPRLLLIRKENWCFTADTSCNGAYVVCTSTEGTHFDHVLTMCNGDFWINGHRLEMTKIKEMVEKRRRSLLQMQPVPGIRLKAHRQQHTTMSVDSAVMTSPSCSPLSTAPQSHASKKKQEQAAVGEGEPSTICGSAAGLQHPASQGELKKSCVKFQSGNSLSDAEGGDDEQAAEVPAQAPSDDGDDTRVTGQDAEYGGCVQSHTFADGAGSKSTRSLKTGGRSKSCSSIAPKSSKEYMAKEYESDSFVSELQRDVTLSQNFKKNPDGTLTFAQTVRSESRVKEEHFANLMHQLLVTAGRWGPVEQHQNTQNPILPAGDPAFRYIRRRIVVRVAESLGLDGMMVVRALGVTEDTINRARDAHPHDLVEKHLYCLRNWCTKSGSQATKETLKKALESCDRRDLVEEVDRLEQEAELSELSEVETSTSEQQKESM
ncbi:uncharacterized protein LOC143290384 isoform X2 [Babylonia areolata]|uniref:uncharacterized protein LOC143290384 isoform X2 n=1 Tax=Babylonia areolata TaxID=304850 RepID=UPI003FD48A3D